MSSGNVNRGAGEQGTDPSGPQSALGLLIVHGIGNQRVGRLRDAVTAGLADANVPPVRTAISSAPPQQATFTLEIREAHVDSGPVLVHEANWATISDPDNPPQVRDTSDVVVAFYRTVRAAWYSATYISPKATKTSSATDPKPLLIWLGIAAIFNALLILRWRLGGSFATLEESRLATGGIGLAVLAFCAYSSAQAVRKWNARRLAAEPRYRMGMLMLLPVVIGWGFFGRPFLFLLGAEILFFFSIAVFVAYTVNLIAWLLTYPFRGAGHVFSRLGLRPLATWVHRLGNVMIVLPSHSYLQAVKASGSLFSILFSEKGAVVRLTTFLWFVWVLLGFLALLLLSEILLLIPLVLVLAGTEVTIELIVAYLVIILPLYLLLLKVLLPAIDLILDVSNYHLASRAEREKYFAYLDRGASALVQRGCKEIHLLAHSLGTVIAYDWLHAREPASYPVVTFHTIGSPLDKFWYIDYGQPGRGGAQLSLENRLAGGWVNHWAYSDPVSGRLRRYNVQALSVTNNRLRWFGPYLWCHGWYWTDEAVVKSIRTSLRARQRSPATR